MHRIYTAIAKVILLIIAMHTSFESVAQDSINASFDSTKVKADEQTIKATKMYPFVTVKGHAYDSIIHFSVTNLMVINKRTNNGIFADSDGRFSIVIKLNDTLILSGLGFKTIMISLADSVVKKEYALDVAMTKLSYTLKAVTVFSVRSLNEIQQNIDALGVKKTYSFTPVDALQSPITFLYERFSKFSKSKRKVAELENEDLKREILKDLFRLYIKYDIIELDDLQFEAFIRYLNLSGSFMQNASQLELVLAIQGKYESFKYRWR